MLMKSLSWAWFENLIPLYSKKMLAIKLEAAEKDFFESCKFLGIETVSLEFENIIERVETALNNNWARSLPRSQPPQRIVAECLVELELAELSHDLHLCLEDAILHNIHVI
jgi:hypothetical protein